VAVGGVGGIGVRYFIARKLGTHVGVDVARGPEGAVLYLQVGGVEPGTPGTGHLPKRSSILRAR